MPKRREKAPVGRPRVHEEDTESASTRIPTWQKDLLNGVAKKNRRTLAAEIAISIEERIKALGLWPADKPQL